MKPVFQTRFGGIKAPPEEAGNCWQAAVASVLEIPLEEAFDLTKYDETDEEHWFEQYNKWLFGYGLACIYFRSTKEQPITCSVLLGYHIAECKSATLKNGEYHVVVIKDGHVVHDPNEHSVSTEWNIEGAYVFIALDASKVARP